MRVPDSREGKPGTSAGIGAVGGKGQGPSTRNCPAVVRHHNTWTTARKNHAAAGKRVAVARKGKSGVGSASGVAATGASRRSADAAPATPIQPVVSNRHHGGSELCGEGGNPKPHTRKESLPARAPRTAAGVAIAEVGVQAIEAKPESTQTETHEGQNCASAPVDDDVGLRRWTAKVRDVLAECEDWLGMRCQYIGDEMPPLLPKTVVLVARSDSVRSRGHQVCIKRCGVLLGDIDPLSGVRWMDQRLGDFRSAEEGKLRDGDWILQRIGGPFAARARDPRSERILCGKGKWYRKRVKVGEWETHSVLDETWAVAQILESKTEILPCWFGMPSADKEVKLDLRKALEEIVHADRELQVRLRWLFVEQYASAEFTGLFRMAQRADVDALVRTDPLRLLAALERASAAAAETLGVERHFVSC